MTRHGQTLRGLALMAGGLLAACDRQPGNPAQTPSTYTSAADSDPTSMEADLMRVGAADDAVRIRDTGDSLLNALGGGTGLAPVSRAQPPLMRSQADGRPDRAPARSEAAR